MNPDNYSDVRLFGESINKELLSVAGNNALEYVKRSMQGVAKEYTDRSIEAGTAVKNHLKDVLYQVDYEYQGSVMTNTHVKGNSDIDLLVLCDKFYYVNNPVVQSKYSSELNSFQLNESQISRLKSHVANAGSYTGDSSQDLRDIRIKSENKMKATYYKCDTTKPKCIAITNQNLHRDVDIVVAAWHKTYEGIRDGVSKKNSIRVYDKDLDDVGRVESPFLSIERINTKDISVNGRLKKMIRFVKTLKYDSQKLIDLSSFEINAICYNIETSKYSGKTFYDLVPVLLQEFAKIVTNASYRDSIMSVDGSEPVFRGKEKKSNSIALMYLEIDELLKDLNFNAIPSYVR
jgi:hypothetical protein